MKQHLYKIIGIACIALFAGCSQCTTQKIESAPSGGIDSYQELAPAITTANGLLMIRYPEGLTTAITSASYKNLLKEDRPHLYEKLEDYTIVVEPVGQFFVVKVFDGDKLVIIDASCTESRIDCWTYRDGCTPETFSVPCLEE